ncbi:MAG TPA: hypothetical protein VEC99_04905 [Clostridia bacterium]|nr:hypothetical protein [Clostridia bacterium]
MMDYQNQLKLQAYLDGELPEGEAREVADWLARDRDAAALLAELRQTQEALTGFEADIKLPETREFFWSKIEREIQFQDRPVRKPDSILTRLARVRRFLVPTVGLAVVLIAGLLTTWRSHDSIETSLEDSGAFTYHDYAAGTTLVWLSYPANSEVADEDDFGTLE